MRFLAFTDMVGILCSGFLFGIQVLQGAVFCSDRIFILATCMGGYGKLDMQIKINTSVEVPGMYHRVIAFFSY